MKFDGFKNNSTVHLLPIVNKNHSRLTRITITEKDTGKETIYLLKDFKYIVKIFNPKNPQIIPEKLFYANDDEINIRDLNACS